jgi:SAM-dependent methyltransferase
MLRRGATSVQAGEMTRSADLGALLAEGEAVPLEGWDFSWFDGRASEQRPSWGYANRIAGRMSNAAAALDIQTGGGEVLAWVLRTATRTPPRIEATDSWPPNVSVARQNLAPLGVTVVEVSDVDLLPFASEAFDLVVSRHPVVTGWSEIARVLRPGGTYLSQQVGAGSNQELIDFMMGAQPTNQTRSPARAVAAAEAAGLSVVDLRDEALRVEFYDVAAVVHFLRKVLWTVPGFTVAGYRHRLAVLHQQIQVDGRFVCHARRFLIEALKPAEGAGAGMA